MSGEEAGKVEVRPGRAIAWRALGDGPPLVLLNGYAATRLDWDPAFLGAVAAHHRVICPDNAGLGDSPLPAGEAVGGVEGMTADAVALFDGLGLERAAVAGWSMGGFVVQSLVRRVPGRIAAAALISTDPGGPERVGAEPGVFATLIDHSGTPREQASRLIALLFPPERATEADARFGDIVAAARVELPERILSEQEHALRGWYDRATAPAPADPSIPTVVIHGGLDRVAPPGNAEVLARLHPGARVEIRPGCAHAPMAQEPDAVAAAILATTGAAG